MIRSRFADETGDGTGNYNANVDGSVTPVIFKIKPAPGQILKVRRVVIFMEDAGSLDSGGYGNGSALANGVLIKLMRFVGSSDETEIILPNLNQLPIIRNQYWKALCHDEILSTYGAGRQSLSWRYTFTKDAGEPLTLADANKEELQFIIQDDLTGRLDGHYFRVGMSD